MTCNHNTQPVLGCYKSILTGEVYRTSLVYDVETDFFEGVVRDLDGVVVETITDNESFYAKYKITQCPSDAEIENAIHVFDAFGVSIGYISKTNIF